MKITMFYDPACVLCRTEAINMQAKKPDNITIVPVAQGLDRLADFGISQLDAMTYLCVENNSTGEMYKGIEAVRILHQVAQTRLAKWLNFPVFKQFSGVVYPIFARHRYRIPNWLTALWVGKTAEDVCTDGVCRLPPKERLEQRADCR
ncbi:MAG: DUF393 domain-containing protein [Moraxella sp.]|nr:DUF393 domain-containing protein [Moraxella sp.]